MTTETILDCGLSLSPQEKGILRKFPFQCPECKCDSFYQKTEDWIVCAHCRHIWILTIINPSRRDCHQDAEETRWQKSREVEIGN